MIRLVDLINESIEPGDYRKDFCSTHKQRPKVYKNTLSYLYNPKEKDNTSKRKAYKNYPWIKYWQAFSGVFGNHLNCTCCGKDIYVDEKSEECILKAKQLGVDPKELKAVGGHFYKNGRDESDGYVILPVCKDCNAKDSSVRMRVNVANVAVEELYATIVDE